LIQFVESEHGAGVRGREICPKTDRIH
jgi:hypothetical protein